VPEACAVVTKRPWRTIALARTDLAPAMLVTCAHIDYFKDKKNTYIVRYENLRQEPETHFAELIDFCGVKDYDIDRVLADSSFENMKKTELNASQDGVKPGGDALPPFW
jgi:hypothetical protein